MKIKIDQAKKENNDTYKDGIFILFMVLWIILNELRLQVFTQHVLELLDQILHLVLYLFDRIF